MLIPYCQVSHPKTAGKTNTKRSQPSLTRGDPELRDYELFETMSQVAGDLSPGLLCQIIIKYIYTYYIYMCVIYDFCYMIDEI